MKSLVILGAGTAGTALANRLIRQLPRGWRITIVDPEQRHLFQPGLLLLPFGAHDEAAILRPRRRTLHAPVHWLEAHVGAVDHVRRQVHLEGGERLDYDWLVIATGARIRPDLTAGLSGLGWRTSTHDFYTLEGAQVLRRELASFDEGRLVVTVPETPIKSPVGPLEFLFLADEHFRRRGIRDRVQLSLVTPHERAFAGPVAARKLEELLRERGVEIETGVAGVVVDGDQRLLRAEGGRELPFDLLAAVPVHSGAGYVGTSGLGDPLDFVPTDKHSLRSRDHERIFVLGDATDLPSVKTGSVARFQVEVVERNLLAAIAGREPGLSFDGHSNCFIESGDGKALLLDFNYDTEPLPGRYPLAGVGPFTLLGESRVNHFGKRALRWAYWNALIPGRPIPIGPRMSMSGKHLPSSGEAQGFLGD